MENLEKVLDKKFAENNATLIEAIDAKFQRTDAKIDKLEVRVGNLEKQMGNVETRVAGLEYNFSELRVEFNERLTALEKKMMELTTTLDTFLKRMLDQEDEFVIIKAEVAQIKNILKEKLGIEVRV